MDLRPQLVAPVLVLAALVPVTTFLALRGEFVVALSVVSVVVIAGSVFYLFSPAEESDQDEVAG